MIKARRRLLVTGADGFVGRWLVRAALAGDWDIVAVVPPDGQDASGWISSEFLPRVFTIFADLRDGEMINRIAEQTCDAVVHLAAIASGPAARRDPTQAWAINAGATAALADALTVSRMPPKRFLLISTGEVYGGGQSGPIAESAPLLPISPYAATKVGAEIAVMEVARRTSLPVVIARPFPHTGPGQSEAYVFPAIAARLRKAAREGLTEVAVGNLSPVRDLLDVRDVVQAYLAMIQHGQDGEIYNVASGEGESLAVSFERLARLTGSNAKPVVDFALLRQADVPVLIGNASKLRQATGWAPGYSREQTFQDLVNAQAD